LGLLKILNSQRRKAMKRLPFIFLVLVCLVPGVALAGGAAEGGSAKRSSYLAQRGTIVPPEEIIIDSYLASIDYRYPIPTSSTFGVYLYSGNRQLSAEGQEEVIQIGIQGGKTEFDRLPPMNLAFVIDRSGSMADADKLDWVKDSFDIFIKQVRDVDYVSLVAFDNVAEVVFPATRMNSASNRNKFRYAVHSMRPRGSTNIREGLTLGCLEVMKNLNREYTNRVMFLSDGCDTCGNTHRDILEVARRFCAEGVTISTIGVGSSFDLELMFEMADVGGGSSRFISDSEEMEATFGSELDRMVVPIAKNLEMILEFLVDVDVLDTWGYENRRSGNLVRYFLPTLHHGDYETILAQIYVHPQRYTGEMELARFSVRYEDVNGNRYESGPHVLSANFVEIPSPVAGFSDGRILESGTILHFAKNLKSIGELYYRERTPANLEQALSLSLITKKELVNARLRLESNIFDDKIEIVDRYIGILGKELALAEEEIRDMGADTEIAPPAPARPIQKQFKYLCREISLDLQGKKQSVVALSGFSSQGGSSPALVEEITDLAFAEISRIPTVILVEQNNFRYVLEKKGFNPSDLTDKLNALEVGKLLGADYIMTGTVMEMSQSVIVFSRLLDVKSGEVESAAQVIVAKI
jgi:TolB-like protein